MNPPAKLLAHVRLLWKSASATARWRAVLGLLGFGLLLWLLLADKPWEIEVRGKMKLPQVVAFWTWWAALLDLVVVGGLMALCPWWTRPLAKRSTLNAQLSTPKWFRPLVILAMVLAAGFALPRMTFGLWDDEELSARQAIVGKFQKDKITGEVSFRLHRWTETFFDYRTPNNHVLHSILSRSCLDTWRFLAKPGRLPFTEWPMRIPALIFGVLAVAALAWFLKETGFAAAGVVAAFILAIHPWHIRYASEARGYSMVICLLPVLFACWRRAVTEGVWRWWAAYAVTQFALIYTYSGTLFVLIILNALTLPVLALSRECARPFSVQGGRWFCANSLAALPSLLLILPLVPQARIYFEGESSRNVAIGWPWLKSALSHLLNGGPWTAEAGYPSSAAHPVLAFTLSTAAVALVLAGMIIFGARGWLTSCLAITTLLSPLLTIGISRLRGMLIYESYIISALPGLIGFAAIGLWALAGQFHRLPAGRVLAPAGVAAAVLTYFSVTQSFRWWLITHPLQQIPESVLASRGTLDPKNDAGILTASFCIPPYLYDGHMVRTDSVAEFLEVMRKADRENKPLVVNIGMPWAAKEYSPGMWALFNRPELFGDHRRFPGLDAGLDRIVARYRPGSVATFNTMEYPMDGR